MIRRQVTEVPEVKAEVTEHQMTGAAVRLRHGDLGGRAGPG